MTLQHPSPLRVGSCQCYIAPNDVHTNLAHIARLVELYAPSVDLIVLPETITTGFSPSATQYAQQREGVADTKLQELANLYNIGIAGSMLLQDDEGDIHNSFFLYSPHQPSQWQSKRHLFSLGGEGQSVVPATERVILSFRGWRILPIICYDLRFPVWCRNVDNEYDLLIAVANWPSPRAEVWSTLLKARAMENLVYTIGSNRIGTDSEGLRYQGDSAIYSPRGEEIASTPRGEEAIAIATLTHEPLASLREKFPVWKDADRFTLEL